MVEVFVNVTELGIYSLCNITSVLGIFRGLICLQRNGSGHTCCGIVRVELSEDCYLVNRSAKAAYTEHHSSTTCYGISGITFFDTIGKLICARDDAYGSKCIRKPCNAPSDSRIILDQCLNGRNRAG